MNNGFLFKSRSICTWHCIVDRDAHLTWFQCAVKCVKVLKVYKIVWKKKQNAKSPSKCLKSFKMLQSKSMITTIIIISGKTSWRTSCKWIIENHLILVFKRGLNNQTNEQTHTHTRKKNIFRTLSIQPNTKYHMPHMHAIFVLFNIKSLRLIVVPLLCNEKRCAVEEKYMRLSHRLWNQFWSDIESKIIFLAISWLSCNFRSGYWCVDDHFNWKA